MCHELWIGDCIIRNISAVYFGTGRNNFVLVPKYGVLSTGKHLYPAPVVFMFLVLLNGFFVV